MKSPHSFFAQVRPEHIGLGAFYYFASIPMINVMTYAGYGRSVSDMSVFFCSLVVAMAAAHLVLALVPGLHGWLVEHVEPRLSLLATAAMLLAGLSALPVAGLVFFFACSVFTGVVCALAVGIWTATPSVREMRPSSFAIGPSLVWAVAFYIVYRFLQFVSSELASGWQVAIPLVGMMALLMAYSPDHSNMGGDASRRRSFLLLGTVCVVYAVGGSVLGGFSGYVDISARIAFSPMVLVEIAGVATICFVCRSLSRRRVMTGGGRAAAVLALVFPLFVLGCLTGVLDIPGDRSNFMWEASIWVLLLAVFVYGMRTSLYAMRGLAVGIMWESWCVGQMTARVVMLSEGLGVVALVCVAAAALYVVSVVLQLTAGVAPGCEAISVAVSDRGAEKGAVQTEIGQASAKRSPYANPVPSTGDAGPGAGSMRPAEGGAASVAEAPDPYPALARRFGLSERELEVLRLLGEGRTAKYISETLVVSFNTARSHVRHVYDKLDVHSRQELIDLIQGKHGRGR